MKNVTFRQMRVFVEFARHLSFARAAEFLHLTPPAVTMQIREFESQIGLPLFDRQGRKVTLTTVGEYVLAHVQRILAAMKDAEDTVSRFKGLAGGTLVIGMVSSAKYFLPRLLAMFRDEHPAIDVRLRLGNREQLVALMQRNEVDLAIMGRPPREWATRAEPFALHPHVLVTAPDHPFTRVGHVPARALAQQGFIVREPGSGTRAALEEYLREHRLPMNRVMEMASNESIKQAVIAGMGVSLLSQHTIALELKLGLLASPDVEGLPLMRRWQVVNNLGKTLSPAAEAFRYFVLERGQQAIERIVGADADPTAPVTHGPDRRVDSASSVGPVGPVG